MMCNFDCSSSLSMDDPRYTFDIHALFAETLLQLLHHASPFSNENDTLHIDHKLV